MRVSLGLLLSFAATALQAQTEALPLRGTQRVEFTTDSATWLSLDVSPDGKWIVFGVLGDLYEVPIAGGGARRISSGTAYDEQPRYSPDGRRIVFISDRSGSENLWAVERERQIDDATPDSARSGLQSITRGRDRTYASPEWSPDGRYVVATQTNRFTWIDVDHSVWIHDVTDGESAPLLVADQPVFGLGAAFGPDPRFVYMAQRSPDDEDAFGHRIDRYDRETGRLTPVVGRSGGAVRPALSPDGRFMVYASRFDGQTGYRLRDLDDGTESWLAFRVQHDLQENNWMGTSSDHMPGYAFTPDGEAIVAGIAGKIVRIAVPSGERSEIPFEVDVALDIAPLVHFAERVPDGPVQVRQIRWPSLSPDGRRLAFTAVHRLFVHDFHSGGTAQVVEMDDLQAMPAWSHDGEWLAFVSWSDFEGGRLFKVRPDGSELSELSRRAAFYEEPVWAPGDAELLVTRGPWQQRGENLEWVRVPASGGEARDVAPATGARVHFGPDRDRFYAYERERGLVSRRLDGSDARVHLSVQGRRPALGPGGPQPADSVLISRDGGHALVRADQQVYRVAVPSASGPHEVSIVDTASAGVRKLSRFGGEFIAWGPAGREVTWSLGRTLFRHRFASDEGAGTVETTISLEFPRQRGAGTLVLRGGRLLTMDARAAGDGIIENGAIVVVDNRIAAVGSSSDVPTPPGAREIDVAGHTLLPGFVDLHHHTRPAHGMHRNTGWDFLNYLAHGVTTGRNPAEHTDSITYSDLVEMGEMIGPRLFSSGPPILNDNDIRSLEDARDVVRRYRHYYGYHTIKQYLTGDRRQRQWMSLAARELRATPTTEGIDMKTMLTQVIDGFSLEHVLPHFPLAEDVIQLMARSGSFYDPTLNVGTGPRPEYYWWTRTEVHDDPKMHRFTPHSILDRETRRRPWFHDGEFYVWEQARDLKRIVEAGGKVGIGSHGEMQGISYHWEIWNVQSGGMREIDALRAATLHGAQAIGFGQDLGSLESDKLADIVVLKRDPLMDIHNTTSLRYVMKNGRLYDADTLDSVWPVERKLPRQYWQGDDPGDER